MIPNPSLERIPAPPKKPVIGNMLDVSASAPVQNLVALARELGPIFQLDMMGKPITVVSGFSLVDELSDESRFDKSVRGALHRVRTISGDGLFTAYTTEPNWSKAHNILLPNFGDRAMQGYHPIMLDIAEQMMLKWQRLNPDDEVDVVHDMTALTLDTIGLCGFGYRFNSFYREDNHPFVDAMVDALEISMSQRGLPFEEIFTRPRQQRLAGDAKYLNKVVDQIVHDRKEQRANAAADAPKTDMLDYMLAGVDRKSGERLDDTNIRYQIITFLIAGHETTSGLLSFATYFLLSNPDVLARAYDEVDRVLGTDLSVKPTMKQVNALTYVQQVLKESLRLWPTAPAFALLPYKDEVLGGKYAVKARAQVVVLLPSLHRDPSVWGERAEIFDPENFAHDREKARPVNAYKPFGNGQRACIGRQFAMQEATLVIGMMLQRFRLIDHTRYQLKLKETLTIKPDGLKIKVRPRVHKTTVAAGSAVAAGPSAGAGIRAPGTATSAASAPAAAQRNGAAPGAAAPPQVPVHGTPLLVLFGSNLGTSEDAARRVASLSERQGFAVRVGWLDDYTAKLPAEGGVLIVCASYNGAPPDNAAGFYQWLADGLEPNALAGVRFAVFGCGNRNWASTYQAVPRFIDERLAAYGAERLFERGEGDAQEDLDGQFRAWRIALWESVGKQLGLTFDAKAETDSKPRYEIEVVAGPQANPLAALHGANVMQVLENRELQTGGGRSTRHVEVALPYGASYRTGDHLGVVGENPPAVVERAMRRFGFSPDMYIRLRALSPRTTTLPVDRPVSVERLLAHYVELGHTATRKQVATLAEHTQCPNTKPKLLGLAADDADASAYISEVKRKRRSVLDLLEEHPACELPFEAFLDMLPAMTPRYYSISSSPLADPDRCSITVGVVREPAWSGHGTFEGVCSTYVDRHTAGHPIDAFVKDSKSGFCLPDDATRPIVMIGPGTGLAPFRGFLQERAALKKGGASLGRALLFFGCRHPDQDYLYREELERYAVDGIVELHTAFSRLDPAKKTYVQHRIAEHADGVWSILEQNGVVYVCGDGSRMEPDVRATIIDLYRTRTGADAFAANAWLDGLTASKRYNLDVWGQT
ncbi:MAG: cytochrome [Candidatus Eremiobacteraeota bacterium]|nr:cytochrome [Candidatus Eremiobacteraeota bacterium]